MLYPSGSSMSSVIDEFTLTICYFAWIDLKFAPWFIYSSFNLPEFTR